MEGVRIELSVLDWTVLFAVDPTHAHPVDHIRMLAKEFFEKLKEKYRVTTSSL